MVANTLAERAAARVGARVAVLVVLVVLGGLGAIGVPAPALAAEADTEAPAAPGEIIALGITRTSVTLVWPASTDNVGVTGYEVHRQYSDTIMIYKTETASMTVTELRPSNTYRFAVLAVDAAGNRSKKSPWTTVIMEPGDSTPPSVPGTPYATEITSTSLVINWGRSLDDNGLAAYLVYREQAGGMPVIAILPQSLPQACPSLRFTNLTPGATYTFRVAARDAAGNDSATSDPVTVTLPGGSESPIS